MADKKRKGEEILIPTKEEEEIKSRGSKNAAIAAKNAAKRLEAARIAAEEAARIAAEEKAAMKKRAPGKKGNTVGQNLSSNLAAAVSSDATDVGKSKQVKKTSQKAFVPVSSSVSSVKTPEQLTSELEEKAYNGILKKEVKPARPVIQGAADLLIKNYSDHPLVTAINSATLHNQSAIQSTFGHESWEYNLLKLPPRIIKKGQKVVPDYNQTIRIQTLEVLGGPGENLLKIPDMPIKGTIAFQQQDNNPNGVLAVALTKALDYLTNEPFMLAVEEKKKKSSSAAEEKKKKSSSAAEEEEEDAQGNQSKVKVIPYTPEECRRVISEIKNASRGDAREKNFCDSLLEAFYKKIHLGSMDEDKMKTIIGVYGSFLNKGLSDTAQGGELIKVWLLKFMEKFKSGGVRPRADKQGELPYWNITCGIPYLKLLSSDKIASALYIRLINLFKGGMTSIQPYKSGGGESSVFYLHKKYVGLIIAMSMNPQKKEVLSPDKQAIVDRAQKIINIFYNKCLQRVTYLEKPGFKDIFLKINEIIQCLYGLIENSDYMNIYDIIEAINENRDAIINYLESCYTKPPGPNPELLPPYMQQNHKCINLLFKAKGGLYSHKKKELEEDFGIRIRNLYNIINCFGTLIQDLSVYVETNKDILGGIFDERPNLQYMRSQAYSMIAETVGYYDNCMFLRGLSLQGCVQKYLEVCQEEVVCAFADVNYGHDQDINHDVLQRLGEQFMLILCNRDPKQLPDFMQYINITFVHPDPNDKFSRDKKYDVNEDQISKIILDLAGFVSICQYGAKKIAIRKIDDYKEDFINKHEYITSFKDKVEIGPVCGKTLTSVDFYVAKPLEIGSKVEFKNNGFNTFSEFLHFIINSRVQEVRTVSTFADLAAPPGCAYAVVGNMAMSYKTFVFNGIEYIYEISTFDLGGNGTQNDNNFRPDVCLSGGVSERFIQIFRPEDLTRYRVDRGTELFDLYDQLEQFSKKLITVKKDNDIDRFFKNIEEFIRTHPEFKEKENQTTFYTMLFQIIDTINTLTNELEKVKGKTGKIGVTREIEKQIKSTRVKSFGELKSLLNQRYIEIYETLADLQQGQPIPSEITDEIIDITTFLQIVNRLPGISENTEVSWDISSQDYPEEYITEQDKGVGPSQEMDMEWFNKSPPSSPKKLSGQAATFASLHTPQGMGLGKRSDSVSSVSSVESLTGASVPYWYYLLTTETPAKGWFIQQLFQRGYDVEKILNSYDEDTLPEHVENEICEVMAVIFCDNISKKVKAAAGDLTIYNECKKTYKRVFSGNYSKNSSADDTTRGILKYIQKATAMETNAGGSKRTRKHKINKNHRKTKHINRKRKTKRLIKNKRRLTKKR